MKLITVEANYNPSDLETAISLFSEQMQTVRERDGCNHYAIFRAPTDDGVLILQKWETMEAFDAYRQSDVFRRLGQSLKPLMTDKPVTTIAEVDTV